jgi:hypothetical protein
MIYNPKMVFLVQHGCQRLYNAMWRMMRHVAIISGKKKVTIELSNQNTKLLPGAIYENAS